MYTMNQPDVSDRPERPRTSRGRRVRAEIPPRPESRRGRQRQSRNFDPDSESYGRPASRVGFSPDSAYRYSHDAYSRQVSSDGENVRLTDEGGTYIPQNSPADSPVDMYKIQHDVNPRTPPQGGDVYPRTPPQRGDVYPMTPPQRGDVYPRTPPQRGDVYPRTPPQRGDVYPRTPPQRGDVYPRTPPQRGDVYPRTPPQRDLYDNPPDNLRYGETSEQEVYRRSPQHSYRHDHGNRPRSHDRPSPPIDYINVSPIMRDEGQIGAEDLHRESYVAEGQGRYSHEPQYEYQHDVQPQYQPYRDSPVQHERQYRDSPSYQDSHYRTSPTREYTPEARHKPPRPKSARPRTARRKSARVRQKHQDYETSQPQQYDASTILNQGDPYGRPSSSLSRYKPLPAIGASTPRNQVMQDTGTLRNQVMQDTSTLRNQVAPDTGILRNHITMEPSPRSSPTKDAAMLGQRIEALSLNEPQQYGNHGNQYHTTDNNESVTTEDIHGATGDGHAPDTYTNDGIPSVDILTNFPQHLSEEIYKQSLLNYSEGQTMDSYDEERDHERKSSPVKTKTSPLRHRHSLPNEPPQGDMRLLLAIRLPDGTRHQRYFRPVDTLQSVLHFAENASSEDFSEFHLACNAPKIIFVDLSQSIGDTQLHDRTVLYLEEKE